MNRIDYLCLIAAAAACCGRWRFGIWRRYRGINMQPREGPPKQHPPKPPPKNCEHKNSASVCNDGIDESMGMKHLQSLGNSDEFYAIPM
jgi:hypothetical protein